MLNEMVAKYVAIYRALEESETVGWISEQAMRAWIGSWGDENELSNPTINSR